MRDVGTMHAMTPKTVGSLSKTGYYTISSEVGPRLFFLPFVHDLLYGVVGEFRAFECIANDALKLCIGEAHNSFLQGLFVHVGGQRGARNGRVGLHEHLGPSTDVLLVDIVHLVDKLHNPSQSVKVRDITGREKVP